MRRWLTCGLLMAVAAGLTVCTGTQKGSRPAPLAMSPEEEQKAAQALMGTTWLIGEFTVAFKEPPEVFVKGGPLAESWPDGVTGEYTFEKGIVEVTALDETRMGTWDGANLVVDGLKAKRL